MSSAGFEIPQSSGLVWDSTTDFGATAFESTWRPSPSPRWQKLLLVRGIPVVESDQFLLAAQDDNSRPAWYVGPKKGSTLDELLQRARERYRYDRDAYQMRFVSAFGQDQTGALFPVGCGGGRARITLDYESRHWMAVGRILVMPELRGTGLSVRIMIYFLETMQTLYETPRLGFVHETRSRHVPRLLEYAEQSGTLESIRLGRRRRLDDEDDTFISFFPGIRTWLADQTSLSLGEAPVSDRSREFIETIQSFWGGNSSSQTCMSLGAFYLAHQESLKKELKQNLLFRTYLDFAETLKHWGIFVV